MALIRICDQCGETIDTDAILGDNSWVQGAVALDQSVRDCGVRKDFHRKCARTVTLAQVWKKAGLVDL